MSTIEVPLHGGGVRRVGELYATRFHTASNPPPEIERILKRFADRPPKAGYYRTKAEIIAVAVKFDKVYAEVGTADDFIRFLKGTGLHLRESSLHEGWFIDLEHIPLVLDACANGLGLDLFTPRMMVERLRTILQARGLVTNIGQLTLDNAIGAAEVERFEEEYNSTHVILDVELLKDKELIATLTDDEVALFMERLGQHLEKVQAQLTHARAISEERAAALARRQEQERVIEEARREIESTRLEAENNEKRAEDARNRLAVYQAARATAERRRLALEQKLGQLTTELATLK